MTGISRILIVLLLLTVSAARAGDLDVLPATERGFQEKIRAVIKPGNRVMDVMDVLEAHRFECREFENKNPVIHCLRMDEPASGAAARFYQVLIEPQGAFVRTVTPSVGRMRR